MLVNISAPWFAYGIIHNKLWYPEIIHVVFSRSSCPDHDFAGKNKKTPFSPWISQSWLHATFDDYYMAIFSWPTTRVLTHLSICEPWC